MVDLLLFDGVDPSRQALKPVVDLEDGLAVANHVFLKAVYLGREAVHVDPLFLDQVIDVADAGAVLLDPLLNEKPFFFAGSWPPASEQRHQLFNQRLAYFDLLCLPAPVRLDLGRPELADFMAVGWVGLADQLEQVAGEIVAAVLPVWYFNLQATLDGRLQIFFGHGLPSVQTGQV